MDQQLNMAEGKPTQYLKDIPNARVESGQLAVRSSGLSAGGGWW